MTKAGPQRSFSIAQKDAVEWLRTLGDGSVDLAITDPPYESLEKYRSVGTTTRLKKSKASSNDWFKIFPNERFEELLVELYRVLAKNSHLYLFVDQATMFVVKPVAEQVGFKFWKPVVWRKDAIGMGYHYRSLYELILFFEKGKRRLNDLGIPDVLDAPRVRNGYPAEKPLSLCETLVKQSSTEEQLVIDPFMGSGVVGMAALGTNRNFMGSDVCDEAVQISRQRMIGLEGAELEPVAATAPQSTTGTEDRSAQAQGAGQLSIGLY